MLIVALQDDVDDLYAIWNTVSDRFLGVNLGKNEAAGIIADYKSCGFEEALDRVENAQDFRDISRRIDSETVGNTIEYLAKEIEISQSRINEYAKCFDGVPVDDKARKKLLESHIRFCEKVMKMLN